MQTGAQALGPDDVERGDPEACLRGTWTVGGCIRRAGVPAPCQPQSQQAVAHIADYDAVHDHILVMSDFLSCGVIKRYPTKFGGNAHTKWDALCP
ncbi:MULTISPECIES: hypothetical protein [unclassified Streptomyces]|uniref:hypothetical protein n=1 Tax=unclassified Streptomyces TaxID=2593676 RepID=UPI002E0F0F33|nr:hypothetical protein OG299_37810 [Streptomyces sp. NBC_01296]